MVQKEIRNAARKEKQASLEAEQNRMTILKIWQFYEKQNHARAIMRSDRPFIKHLAPLHDKEPMEIDKSALEALTERLAKPLASVLVIP